jgi:hypothetical protein
MLAQRCFRELERLDVVEGEGKFRSDDGFRDPIE